MSIDVTLSSFSARFVFYILSLLKVKAHLSTTSWTIWSFTND